MFYVIPKTQTKTAKSIIEALQRRHKLSPENGLAFDYLSEAYEHGKELSHNQGESWIVIEVRILAKCTT